MTEGLKKFLKVIFPLALGTLLIFLFYRQLDAESINAFINHFKDANYWWVLAATFIAYLSHISRTMRWQMMLKSLGYNVGFFPALYSVFVNYLVNLGIPRTGEIARCGVLSQYYKVPFDKSFGALVNERVIDVVFLALTGIVTFVFQYDVFITFTNEHLKPFLKESKLFQNSELLLLFALVGLFMVVIAVLLIKKGKFPLQAKFAKAFSGIKEGLLSIKHLENPLAFIAHSLFIWLMYWLMIYVVFFAVKGGEAITPMAAMSILFFGTFAFIAVSGGFGAYPIVMGLVVSLYGMDAVLGNAVGWLLWGGQTILIIVAGAWAFFMLSFVKTQKKLQ